MMSFAPVARIEAIEQLLPPIESNKPLYKDEDGSADVYYNVDRSMIGSKCLRLASRPDIMFAVCACARFQVTPKVSHLNAVKRIFRYLKHQPKLGLWYPRDSPFELEAYSDSDYGGAILDRKSTIGGCQFLGRRLISWQCKKQTIMENSTTKAEYVAAANFMGSINGIKSYEDNGQSILRSDSHFIRDLYENRLIELSRFIVDLMFAEPSHQGFDVHQRFKLLSQLDTFVPMDFEATKARLKRYREELQTTTSKKQKIDDKDVPAIGEKVVEVKEEEPVKRTGKRKKQKARIGISVDKNAQGDSETDKEESVEAINPTPLLQTLK
ncbi:hypothetical protein Tco_0600260 [Tanacetum coccineum]|uniref:Uncharacterized protein n=1 Tax=Tanacetum coccineum TaxID=301880 RepID=A0ABQ4WB72_9ASTR